MLAKLVDLLGPPDSSFSQDKSHWWSSRSPDESSRAMRMGAKSFPVYAYPHMVTGGQRYDVNFVEK